MPVALVTKDLFTPYLELDLDALERNVQRMAGFAAKSNLALRPHAKTHKSPYIAHLQCAEGSVGVACATLSEAEVLAGCGIKDILVTAEIVTEGGFGRAASLASYARLSLTVESMGQVSGMGAAARKRQVEVDVLVTVDVGQGRSGLTEPEDICEIAQRIVDTRGLFFKGLQAYDGHLQFRPSLGERAIGVRAVDSFLVEVRAELDNVGLIPSVVTGGGTGTSLHYAGSSSLNEIQPGSYVVMDSRYASIDGLPFEHALFVVATVVSRRTKSNDVVLDAGFKTLSSEYGNPVVDGHPLASLALRGDHHAIVHWSDGARLPELGERIRLIPSHCDTTVNLFDHYVVTRMDAPVAMWKIYGRGKNW